MEAGQRTWRVGLERGNLRGQDRAACRILVANIDVDVLDADSPRGDEHSLDEPVRVAFQVVPILERAGLALVDIDGHQPRRRLGAHDAPLAADGKSGAAQSAQPRILHRCQNRFERTFAAHTGEERAIAGIGAIGA